MRKIVTPLFVAVVLAGSGLLAAAPSALAQSYPRVTGSGENLMVDYGPMGQGTLVGGGRVMVSSNSGMNVDIVHLDAQFVQRAREGYVPLTIGSGESAETVWVPARMVTMLRDARAGMPPR